jgi:tetratricopeptide (TPR) repeat protein
VGWIHYLRREADKVLSCAEKELKHRDAAHAGASERASAIRLRGLGYRLKNDYAAAITDYGTALDLYATLPAETADVAIVLNYRGEMERLSGDYVSAERDFQRSLEVAKTVGFDEGVACYTGDLAQLALDKKDWAHAEDVARIALPLSETVGRQELIADASHRLAIALVSQGKAADALPYVNRAVEIYTKLRSPDLADAEATRTRCEAHEQ